MVRVRVVVDNAAVLAQVAVVPEVHVVARVAVLASRDSLAAAYRTGAWNELGVSLYDAAGNARGRVQA